jgi:hypothetical protein
MFKQCKKIISLALSIIVIVSLFMAQSSFCMDVHAARDWAQMKEEARMRAEEEALEELNIFIFSSYVPNPRAVDEVRLQHLRDAARALGLPR